MISKSVVGTSRIRIKTQKSDNIQKGANEEVEAEKELVASRKSEITSIRKSGIVESKKRMLKGQKTSYSKEAEGTMQTSSGLKAEKNINALEGGKRAETEIHRKMQLTVEKFINVMEGRVGANAIGPKKVELALEKFNNVYYGEERVASQAMKFRAKKVKEEKNRWLDNLEGVNILRLEMLGKKAGWDDLLDLEIAIDESIGKMKKAALETETYEEQILGIRKKLEELKNEKFLNAIKASRKKWSETLAGVNVVRVEIRKEHRYWPELIDEYKTIDECIGRKREIKLGDQIFKYMVKAAPKTKLQLQKAVDTAINSKKCIVLTRESQPREIPGLNKRRQLVRDTVENAVQPWKIPKPFKIQKFEDFFDRKLKTINFDNQKFEDKIEGIIKEIPLELNQFDNCFEAIIKQVPLAFDEFSNNIEGLKKKEPEFLSQTFKDSFDPTPRHMDLTKEQFKNYFRPYVKRIKLKTETVNHSYQKPEIEPNKPLISLESFNNTFESQPKKVDLAEEKFKLEFRSRKKIKPMLAKESNNNTFESMNTLESIMKAYQEVPTDQFFIERKPACWEELTNERKVDETIGEKRKIKLEHLVGSPFSIEGIIKEKKALQNQKTVDEEIGEKRIIKLQSSSIKEDILGSPKEIVLGNSSDDHVIAGERINPVLLEEMASKLYIPGEIKQEIIRQENIPENKEVVLKKKPKMDPSKLKKMMAKGKKEGPLVLREEPLDQHY